MRKTVIQVFSVNLVSKVFVGLAVVLAIRCMTESEYAVYTLALAIATVALQTFAAAYNVIYVVGFEALGLEEDPGPFVGLQLLTLGMGIVAALAIFRGSAALFWACAGFVFCGILSEYSKTCFQQRLQFGRYSGIELLRTSVFLVCAAAFAWQYRGALTAWQMLWGQAAAMLIVFLIAGRPLLRWSRAVDRRAMAKIARAIWSGPYRFAFAYFIVMAALSQTDVWSLKFYSPRLELASYGAAFRYYTLLQMALGTVSVVLLPSLQKVKSTSEFRAVMAEHRRLLWIFGAGAVAAACLAGWLIPVLDGGKYPGSIPVFRILSASAIVSFALSPYASLLVRFCEFRFLMRSVTAVLVGNVALLAIVVPSFGATGAAAVVAICYAVMNGATFARAQWRLRSTAEIAMTAGAGK